MADKSDVVSVVEAAYELAVSYEVALRLVLTHQLKGERRGRRWVVDREDLERLTQERRRAPMAGAEVASRRDDTDANT